MYHHLVRGRAVERGGVLPSQTTIPPGQSAHVPPGESGTSTLMPRCPRVRHPLVFSTGNLPVGI